jgi:hypothetical protein
MRFNIMIEVVVFVSIVLVLSSALFAYVQRDPIEQRIDSNWVSPTK